MGEWGFRDFSRLLPAEENRAQPADPSAVFYFREKVLYGESTRRVDEQ